MVVSGKNDICILTEKDNHLDENKFFKYKLKEGQECILASIRTFISDILQKRHDGLPEERIDYDMQVFKEEISVGVSLMMKKLLKNSNAQIDTEYMETIDRKGDGINTIEYFMNDLIQKSNNKLNLGKITVNDYLKNQFEVLNVGLKTTENLFETMYYIMNGLNILSGNTGVLDDDELLNITYISDIEFIISYDSSIKSEFNKSVNIFLQQFTAMHKDLTYSNGQIRMFNKSENNKIFQKNSVYKRIEINDDGNTNSVDFIIGYKVNNKKYKKNIDIYLNNFLKRGEDKILSFIKNTQSFNKSMTDQGTGLANRHFLQEIKEDYREKPHTMIILDIDTFKAVNDEYGHKFGDEVLITFAKILIETGADIFRVGGEEFIILLDVYDIEEVTIFLNKLSELLRNIIFEISGKDFYITATKGLYIHTGKDNTNFDKRWNFADDHLYSGKKDHGRNTDVIGGTNRELSVGEKGKENKGNIENLDDSCKVTNLTKDKYKKNILGDKYCNVIKCIENYKELGNLQIFDSIKLRGEFNSQILEEVFKKDIINKDEYNTLLVYCNFLTPIGEYYPYSKKVVKKIV